MERAASTNQHQIVSLQALRALSYSGIFLYHAGSPISWPALGVSTFFVLSGFLMTRKYFYYKFDNSIIDNLKFAINKSKNYIRYIY